MTTRTSSTSAASTSCCPACDFRYMVETCDWGVLSYTFHPQVIGRGHRMLMLERLIESLAERGAAFARMDVAAAEFAERVPLTR